MTARWLPDRQLPLFPLRTVLFPGGLLELKIFEARYLDLMSRCMRESRPFGVVALRSGGEARVSPDPVALHELGTLAEIIDVDSASAGILVVRCRGTQRFALEATSQQADGLWVGDAREFGDDPGVPPDASHGELVEALASAAANLAAQGAAPFLEPHRFDDAAWVANRWCEILPLPIEVRQRLLAIDDPIRRLDVIDSLLRVEPEPPVKA